ncbi:uncharacterized protein B0T15DRAFT_522307 [Chaetomium strumarium]|uniref:Chitin-binding type-1 domain-containing protein n=1 Tax=Chaetomium strumarium TaxID=1170767 RepID=A0AAJ0H570_9PEZI|nr:hypothetical protein B0T15DRAFT_522307 [Chaetomium strumarium]
MKSILVGLAAAAALCWTGALGVGASPAGDGDVAEVAAMAARRHLSRLSTRHRNNHNNATSDFAELGLRQDNGQCGAQYGRCAGDLCCSSYGFCGDSIDHCHPLFDCQPSYGVCGWPRTTAAPTPTSTTSSTTSSSSTPAPPTTTTSTTPTTTSRPTTSSSSSSTFSAPLPSGSLQVTTNGQCGNNTICIGNPNFGPCCSQFFWCGSSLDYCGAGCQGAFGACFGVPGQPGNPPTNGTTTTTSASSSTTSSGGITTSPPPPITTTTTSTTSSRTTSTTTSASPTVSIPAGMTSSRDGRCGNNVTCLGSNFGRCCSQFGYCGDGDQYCPYIVGCQPEFGYCDPPP